MDAAQATGSVADLAPPYWMLDAVHERVVLLAHLDGGCGERGGTMVTRNGHP